MARPDTAPALVLVTGGSGFLGHHLVEALLARGNEVRNVDFIPGRIRSPRLTHWPGSFLDEARLREAMAGIDTVYHLAATRFPRESNRDPTADAEENLIGTLALLDLAVESGVRRVVFCSSGGTVYGPTETLPIAETHPTDPISAYGIVKLAIEKYLRLYSRLHGLGTVALRLANPYGPHQNIAKAQGALTTFCRRALDDKVIHVWGDGSVERDFVYVGDVARALILAGASGISGREINIGSGRGTSLNELIEHIQAFLGRPLRTSYEPGRTFDVPRNHLDIALAAELLGWRPEVPLDAGIGRLLAFMQSEARQEGPE